MGTHVSINNWIMMKLSYKKKKGGGETRSQSWKL